MVSITLKYRDGNTTTITTRANTFRDFAMEQGISLNDTDVQIGIQKIDVDAELRDGAVYTLQKKGGGN